jgi:hypothetical protein
MYFMFIYAVSIHSDTTLFCLVILGLSGLKSLSIHLQTLQLLHDFMSCLFDLYSALQTDFPCYPYSRLYSRHDRSSERYSKHCGHRCSSLHGARLPLEGIHQIKGAPKVIIGLKDELRFFEVALKSLQAVEQPEWNSLGSIIADQANLALTTCSGACASF